MLSEDRDEDGNGRMCIVTRESGPVDDALIRFVATPDGRVIVDLKRQLPGRGCWVKAERALVEKAVQRKLFGRALKTDVTVDVSLADEVDRALVVQLSGMMNMARKAGQFVTGSSRVEQAVRAMAVLAVFHATDAAADGVRKIDQARKAMSFVDDEGLEVPKFRFCSEAEMEGLLGSNAFIHAAALAGQAGEGVVKRAKMLEKYRGTVAMRIEDDAGLPAQ